MLKNLEMNLSCSSESFRNCVMDESEAGEPNIFIGCTLIKLSYVYKTGHTEKLQLYLCKSDDACVFDIILIKSVFTSTWANRTRRYTLLK